MKMGKSEIKILIIYIGRQNMCYQQWYLSKYFALPYFPSDALGCRKMPDMPFLLPI